MADFGALTMVGLIATILSIGFALAAFINSRRRLEKNPDKSEDGPPSLPFLAPNEQPGSVRTTQAPYYSTASRRVSGGEQTKPAFKQVQALGAQSGQMDAANSDEYLWE